MVMPYSYLRLEYGYCEQTEQSKQRQKQKRKTTRATRMKMRRMTWQGWEPVEVQWRRKRCVDVEQQLLALLERKLSLLLRSHPAEVMAMEWMMRMARLPQWMQEAEVEFDEEE